MATVTLRPVPSNTSRLSLKLSLVIGNPSYIRSSTVRSSLLIRAAS